MNNIVLDFRHYYVRGERMGAQELVYQYDTGRVIEAYIPRAEAGFVLNIGFERDATLSVITVDSVTADEEGGYKILATIPDPILTRYGNLLVYIVAGDENMVATTYEGQVPVRHKAVAEDYVEPTGEEMSILERCAIAANAAEIAAGVSEAAAESTAGSTEAAAASEANALSYAERAETAAGTAEDAASEAADLITVTETITQNEIDALW